MNFTGRIQAAGQVGGPYQSVAGARSPFSAGAPTGLNRFWRSVISDVRSIAAGNDFSMALRKGGTLWTWGRNDHGQLGTGNTNGTIEPVQVGTNSNWRTVSAGAGAFHALAIRDDGTLWAWGDNQFGQLGLGHTNEVLEPVQVGADTLWESVSAGWLETFAIRTDGTMWAWGDNRYGQLGLGSTNPLPVMQPTQIGSDSDWKSVAASRGSGQPGGGNFLWFAHCLALKEDGTLWAWGDNGYGQLGLGDTTPWPYAVTNLNVGIRHDGTLWASGNNFVGQLAQPTHWAPAPIAGDDWRTPFQTP